MIAGRWWAVVVSYAISYGSLVYLTDSVELPDNFVTLLVVYGALVSPIIAGFWLRQIGVLRAGSNQLGIADQRMVYEYRRRLDNKAVALRQKVDNFPK